MRSGLLPRLQDCLFIALLIGALLTGSRMLNTDGDLGRHLTLGGYIISSHHIPSTDILSYTRPGISRPPYEWLAQVLLAALYRALNLDGVVLLTAAAIAAAFSIVYMDSVHRSRAPILALLVTSWAALASSLHWLARPHIFTFVFFALWLSWLEDLRRGQKLPLWQFPALMLVWSNTHGGFVFGFLALAVYLVGWIIDLLRGLAERPIGARLIVIGTTSLIASFVTPDLWHNWDAVLNNRSTYIISSTIETMPLGFTTPGIWPFLAMVAAVLVLLTARRFQVPTSQILLLGLLAVASVAIVRNIPLFAIAAAPLLTEWVAQVMRAFPAWRGIEERFAELESGFKRYLWSTVALVAVICLFAFRDTSSSTPFFMFRPDIFPAQAADWIVAHQPSGRMFNDFNWGGYLLYRLWPAQQVFIDSQSDFYGEALTREAAAAAAGEPGWQHTLDEYKIGWIIVPRNAGLVSAALSSSDWAQAYEDNTAILLVRK